MSSADGVRVALLCLGLFAACTDPPSDPPAWQVVLEHMPGALLRVYGRSARDVYVVGSDGDGSGPMVLHYDGNAWRRLQTGARGTLWWMERVGEDDYRMVGEGGLVLGYQPSSDRFVARHVPGGETLFGVWPLDGIVYYVGGDVIDERGVLYADDGSQVRIVPTATTTPTLFKIHGTPETGLLTIVGQNGYTARLDGQSLTPVPLAMPTRVPLFTLHGQSSDALYAVGGVADGLVLRNDGSAWINETPDDAQAMNGVWAVSKDQAYAAGFNGHVLARQDGVWRELEGVPTYLDLHSVWVDPEGGIWAAGGQLASTPPRDGVLVHYGPPVVSGGL